MKLKIIVNGAKGRMGQAAVKAIEATEDLQLVAAIGRGDDLRATVKHTQADIVVDLTLPECVFENTKIALEENVHPVIGATGLTEEQIHHAQEMAANKQLGGIIAPNFSIGALLMMRFAREAAKYFNYAEIIEMHHEKKLDAPSGTAKRTAEMMSENFNAGKLPKTTETVPHTRGGELHQIPIHAVRLPGLLAHQQVIFGEAGETFKISHDTINRDCFMPGILLACRKVKNLKTLVNGLDNILFPN